MGCRWCRGGEGRECVKCVVRGEGVECVVRGEGVECVWLRDANVMVCSIFASWSSIRVHIFGGLVRNFRSHTAYLLDLINLHFLCSSRRLLYPLLRHHHVEHKSAQPKCQTQSKENDLPQTVFVTLFMPESVIWLVNGCPLAVCVHVG